MAMRGGKVQMMLEGGNQMEDWLQSKGLGRFTDHFLEFGIENIHDLLDDDIVSDRELAGEIGMTSADIDRFRRAVNENRVCEWDDISDMVMERNARAAAIDPAVYDYALFVRKMKSGMYFVRLDHKGKQKRCSVKMCKRNKSFVFSYGTKPIELAVTGLRGVHELVDFETGDTKHPELLKMMTEDEAELCFLLSFNFKVNDTDQKRESVSQKKKDDDANSGALAAAGAAPMLANKSESYKFDEKDEENQKNDDESVRPLNKRKKHSSRAKHSGKGSSAHSFANNAGGDSNVSDADDDGAPLLQSQGSGAGDKSFKGKHKKEKEQAHEVFGAIAAAGAEQGAFDQTEASSSAVKTKHLQKACTVSNGGMMVLVLLCRSPEDLKFAVNGFKQAAIAAKKRAKERKRGTVDVLEDEMEALSDVCAQECEKSLKCLHYFHHLYRPHHHHNHPPSRFHNGIVAEVHYDPSFEIVTMCSKTKKQMNRMKMPSPQFMKGMFLRARITGYDKDEETYIMDYLDGPYFGDEEANGEVHFKLPQGSGKHFKFILQGVKDTFLIVDLEDNYGTVLPLVIIGISILQIAYFLQYIIDHDYPITVSSPVAGHPDWRMKIISDWPVCDDMRPEIWRFFTHQFVHAGYLTISFNVFIQVIFGLPLNMVHGQLRFALIYGLGIFGGAMAFIAVGGGFGQLIGASGGVYSILGMHLAEIMINWDMESKGIMNHWTRLVVLGVIIFLDIAIYYFTQIDNTSYTASIGGLIVGVVGGVMLLDNPEVGWFERSVLFPLARLTAFILFLWAIVTYIVSFPPKAIVYQSLEPCCWQLLQCDDINQKDYGLITCEKGTQLKQTDGLNYLDTCPQFKLFINLAKGITDDAP